MQFPLSMVKFGWQLWLKIWSLDIYYGLKIWPFFYHLTLIPISHPIYIDWRMVASHKIKIKIKKYTTFSQTNWLELRNQCLITIIIKAHMRFDLACIWKKWIIIGILVNKGKSKKITKNKRRKDLKSWLIDWLTSPKPEYIVISVYFVTTSTLLMIIDIACMNPIYMCVCICTYYPFPLVHLLNIHRQRFITISTK